MITEKVLTDKSIDFANKYINTEFKSKDLVDVHLAVNGVAHGFFMGVRHGEKIYSKSFLPHKAPMADTELSIESQKAAKFYIKQKHKYSPEGAKIILSATVAHGFREGLRFSENPS